MPEALSVEQVWNLFSSLYPTLEEQAGLLSAVSLLAHYTSLDAVEKIVQSGEVWLSNPLFMNDLEEVRFGILQGIPLLKDCQELRTALGTDARNAKFLSDIEFNFRRFENEHAFDTYVFCVSEFAPNDDEGRLSMWRGYGRGGRGAAIVFDVSKLILLHASPLILARVEYGTTEQRIQQIRDMCLRIAKVVSENNIPDDKQYLIAEAAFERLKVFALFTKHRGFEEEREWRLVYMPDRDPNNLLKSMFHYTNGARGVEPKLRLKVQALPGAIPDGVSLESLTKKIVLGPTHSSVLALRSVRRMFELMNKPEFAAKVVASGIPLRPE
jgi:hypothetical protein